MKGTLLDAEDTSDANDLVVDDPELQRWIDSICGQSPDDRHLYTVIRRLVDKHCLYCHHPSPDNDISGSDETSYDPTSKPRTIISCPRTNGCSISGAVTVPSWVADS